MSMVSVVIPAYQNADFIEDTVRSVLAQTYPQIEVVIADHSSTDGTWEILQQFASDPRVTLLRTEAGGGAPRNWNRVTEAATGRYLKLVCGDDLLSPHLIERQVAALEADPEAVLTACRRSIVDAQGASLLGARGLSGLPERVDGPEAVRRAIRSGTNPFGEPMCVLMRREALTEAGGWDGRFPYLIDELTYARVLEHGGFVAVPDVLASFRVSAGQWSVALAKAQAQQAIAFNRWFADRHPGVVSSRDLLLGNARAWGMARARRLVYAVLGRRMRATAGPS